MGGEQTRWLQPQVITMLEVKDAIHRYWDDASRESSIEVESEVGHEGEKETALDITT